MGDATGIVLLSKIISGTLDSLAGCRKRLTRDGRHQLAEGKASQPAGRSLHAGAVRGTFVKRLAISLLALLFSPTAIAQVKILQPQVGVLVPPGENNGQDTTRILRRFDFRYQYQNPTGTNNQAHIFTFRVDDFFRLNERWRISGRFELPLAYTDRVSPAYTNSDGADGEFRFGIGDVVAQVLGIYDINERTAMAFGTQLVFPSASSKNLGGDQYLLVPMATVRWMLPEISAGSFFAPTIRYGFDIARSSGRGHTSELQFSPTVNIMLPERWFVTLFPATAGGDIRYNFERQPGEKGRLFLPADFAVGKMLGRSTVGSLEIGVPVVKDYKSGPGTYDFKIEARIGFFW